jgi:hypothetical protein
MPRLGTKKFEFEQNARTSSLHHPHPAMLYRMYLAEVIKKKEDQDKHRDSKRNNEENQELTVSASSLSREQCQQQSERERRKIRLMTTPRIYE